MLIAQRPTLTEEQVDEFRLEFNLTFGFGALSCWQVSVDFG
jgi:hypothetical protein